MPLLIDAFNCLHVTGVLPPDVAGLDLEDLAGLVARSRYGREEVWIVCDGAKPPAAPASRPGGIFTWAGAGATADDLLIGLVQRSSAPRTLTVVTSDRAIAKAVRRRGASVVSSEDFLRTLSADHAAARPTRRPEPRKPEVPLASRDVWEWLQIFGLGPAERAIEGSSSPKAPRAVPKTASPKPTPQRRIANFRDLEGIDLADFDMAELLRGTPPPRSGPRAPRRSRRDRG